MKRYFNNMSPEKEKALFKKVDLWASYWRENPHRFTIDFLGIKLKLFQQILMYQMFHNDTTVFIAARGLGKSWLTAVVSCVRCILYPNSKIVIAASTKKQASQIITDKIQELINAHPNLAIEIKDIEKGNGEIRVLFENGSTIEAVASNEGARGKRATVLIIDEYVLTKENVYQEILKPFTNYVRPVGFTTNYESLKEHPEYADWEEANQYMFMSSAKYKIDWYWKLYQDSVNEMLGLKLKKEEIKDKDGKVIDVKISKIPTFVTALPYTLSVFHKLLRKEQVENDREKFDIIRFAMENEAIFYGENSASYFKLNEIQPCRTLRKAFYPLTIEEYLKQRDKRKKKVNYPDKVEGEVRIISADIALMGGSDNDNSIFTCFRAIPQKDGYRRLVPYIESHNGLHSEDQAIRLNQLYYDFDADYIAMDCNGNGISVYDDITKVLYDNERDIEYPGLKSFNDPKMAERAKDPNAKPVLFTIKATGNNTINNDMAVYLKQCFLQNRIELLVDDAEIQQENKSKAMKSTTDTGDRGTIEAKLGMPYVQTTAFMNEVINLTYEVKTGGDIVISEKGRNRKDRYSSMGYGNYLITLLEKDLNTVEENNDILNYCYIGYGDNNRW